MSLQIKHAGIATLFVTFAALTAQQLLANAVTMAPVAAADVTEALPKDVAILGLEVAPAELKLHGKHDYAQLLITARLAGGDSIDVTRLAKIESVDGLVQASPFGQVQPRK
ncbi:MAG: hypothetical protein JWL90_2609, partial [Chthoniobacteraceae bacterium]|nr:hypothetical protein [Chthoniobacteraceae bacterium]